MRWKLIVVPALAFLFLTSATSGRAQVTHAGTEGKFPLTVGFGVSNYSIDWGHSRRMVGIGAWADWRFRGLPGAFRGLGLSLEGQRIAYNTPSDLQHHEESAFLTGPSYQIQKWQRVRPYVKYMFGFGKVEDAIPTQTWHATISSPGLGADVRVWNHVVFRGDYEYQFWHDFIAGNALNPNGFTFGAAWDFGYRPGPQ